MAVKKCEDIPSGASCPDQPGSDETLPLLGADHSHLWEELLQVIVQWGVEVGWRGGEGGEGRRGGGEAKGRGGEGKIKDNVAAGTSTVPTHC